ncbi:MAG: YfcE family phosphodiesterase [Candidatus Jordarchaeales archaeon]
MSDKIVLVLGDTHIPDRVTEIPRKLKSFIESESFDLVLSTGDLTSQEVLSWMKKIAPLKVVRGNMDYLPLPEKEVLHLPPVKIGLVHGTGIWPRGDTMQLLKVAETLGTKILISGHTHHPDVKLAKNTLLLNPGSATGAWGGSSDWGLPSVMTLTLSESEIKVVFFLLERGELKKKEEVFKIQGEGIAAQRP